MANNYSVIEKCLQKPSIVSYSEVPVFVNDQFILAESLSISNSRSIKPNFSWISNTPNRYFIEEAPSLEVSIDYYPTLLDTIYSSIESQSPIKLEIMGKIYDKCYITSYSIKGSEKSLIKCSASIVVWNFNNEVNFIPQTLDLNNGWMDIGNYQTSTSKPDINIAHSSFSIYEQYYKPDRLPIMSIPSSFSLSVNAKYYSTIKVGNKFPSSFLKGEKGKSLNLEGELVNKIVELDIYPRAYFSLKLKDICENFLDQFFYKDSITSNVNVNDNLYSIEGFVESINGSASPKGNYGSSLKIVSWD
jgi:hypothetical protein